MFTSGVTHNDLAFAHLSATSIKIMVLLEQVAGALAMAAAVSATMCSGPSTAGTR
jgi:hypothetical protein